MSAGKWTDAAKYYGPISNAPWPDYQMRANNAIGRALAGEKKYDEALDKFKAVVGSDLATPEANRQKNLASVGQAVSGRDRQGGRSRYALAKPDRQERPAGRRAVRPAYNALGPRYIKLNKPKDAVLALLHTDVLFYNDADAHAERFITSASCGRM